MSEPFVEKIPPELQDLVTRLDAYARSQSSRPSLAEIDFPSLEARDFRLLRVVGRGGMGTVYVAEQISLERQVAVKVLASDLVKNDQDRARFEREAKLIAMLHHPGIVKVLSAGEVDGHYFYAMELIDGQSLDKVHFRDLNHLASICIKIANALAYAHQCGVLHRDIKPANIFLDRHEEVHVGDFGIAFTLCGSQQCIEAEGHPSGTPAYIAPERLERGENTIRSDIYSFGIMLQSLSKASHLRVTHDFNAIVQRCIATHPEERYAQIQEVADDLISLIHHRPVKAAHPTSIRRLSLWVRRNPLYGLIAMLFLIVLLFIGTQESIDYAQRLKARHQLAQCFIPIQHDVDKEESLNLKRIIDLAERTLGRYPNDGPIVEKTLELYDDYMRLQYQRGRNFSAYRETERILSTFEVLYWNPNISNSVKERLIELQFLRYEMIRNWGDQAELDYFKEKIEIELEHYSGEKEEHFRHRFASLPTQVDQTSSHAPGQRHRRDVRRPSRQR